MSILGTYHGATLLNEENSADTNIKNKIKLEYYTMEKQMRIKSKQVISYGISIIKKEYENNEVKCEKHSVENISTNENKVKDIVNLLKEHKVTPIALEDVLEDLLKQKKYETRYEIA